MKLYTHNDPAAPYRADKAAWQQMRLYEADPDVVAYQEIRLKGKDNVLCAQMYDKEGREYQREWAQRGAAVGAQRTQRRAGQESGSEGTQSSV